MTPTFAEHTRQAQEHPAHWSCLMTLELTDALVASRQSVGAGRLLQWISCMIVPLSRGGTE